jgi:hypothetical protein
MFMAAESFNSIGDFGRHILVVLRYLFRSDPQARREEMMSAMHCLPFNNRSQRTSRVRHLRILRQRRVAAAAERSAE